ncbi:MAG: FlgD immunoglobulin-like domain containing protein [Candidatus Krumholzibacteriia bacterium]
MRAVVLVALLLVFAAPVIALDTATRPVGPVLEWRAGDLARFDASWLHVKFVEGSEIALVDGRLVSAGGADLTSVAAVLDGAAQVRRTFPGPRDRYRDLQRRGEAAGGGRGPDLSLWFDVQLAPDRAGLAATLNALNALPVVEIAHPAPVCENAVIRTDRPAAPHGDPDLRTPSYTHLQDYLYETPVGLDAPSAWAMAGGRGQGVKFIDVELGWTWTHEDFDIFRQFYQGGVADLGYIDHGTAVLGEIMGQDNGFGVTGFAPDVRWGTVAITVDEWPDVPHYFQQAIDHLDAGDVWLIELQMYPPGRDATPMEWLQVNYDVIWTGCWAEGVVCVEAGANGSQNLDDAGWGGVFDRTVRRLGRHHGGRRHPYRPRGRVVHQLRQPHDVHAWGSSIVTTGYGDLYNGGSPASHYTAGFGGTSGASPMITGSAICLQGIAKVSLGAPLSPSDLRALLHDTGIPHLGSQLIGPRPDLGAAAAQLVDITAAEGEAAPGGLSLTSALSPFSHETAIRFRQAVPGAVRLDIYDVAGRHVRSLEAGPADVGPRVLQWDGRNAGGREVGSGVYLFRLSAGGEAVSGRLVKVR